MDVKSYPISIKSKIIFADTCKFLCIFAQIERIIYFKIKSIWH